MAVSCWRKQLEIDFDGGHLQTEAVFGWDLHNGFTVVATLNLDGDIGQVCTYWMSQWSHETGCYVYDSDRSRTTRCDGVLLVQGLT